jgi:hypothetical protein
MLELDPVTPATAMSDHPTALQPAKMIVRIAQEDGRVTMQFDRARVFWGLGLGFFVWLVGWGFPCFAFGKNLLADPNLGAALIAATFCAPWIVAAAYTIYLLFGREVLEFSREGITARASAVVPLRRQFLPWHEIANVVGSAVWRKTNKGGWFCRNCLEIRARGRMLRFAEGISLDEAKWLASETRRIKATLGASET